MENMVLYLRFESYPEIIKQKWDQFNSPKMKNLQRKDEEQP